MNKNELQLISVIVNCYNGEEYLRVAIDSVIAQTHKNWEIIFWDNKSTDSSAKIVKGFCDKRLRYFLAENHTVLYRARNDAIRYCEGKYIAFLDSDDVWENTKLEKQLNKFNSDKKLVLVYTKRNWIDCKSNILDRRDNKKLSGNVTSKLLIKNFIPMSSVMIKSDILSRVGGFNPIYNLLGDYDMWVRISSAGHVGYINEKLLNDRLHANSTTNKNLDKWIIEQRSFYMKFLETHKLKYINIIYYIMRNETVNFINNFYRKTKLAKKYIYR